MKYKNSFNYLTNKSFTNSQDVLFHNDSCKVASGWLKLDFC